MYVAGRICICRHWDIRANAHRPVRTELKAGPQPLTSGGGGSRQIYDRGNGVNSRITINLGGTSGKTAGRTCASDIMWQNKIETKFEGSVERPREKKEVTLARNRRRCSQNNRALGRLAASSVYTPRRLPHLTLVRQRWQPGRGTRSATYRQPAARVMAAIRFKISVFLLRSLTGKRRDTG